MTTTGGARLKASIAAYRQAGAGDTSVSIGFHERGIAALAAQLEFGSPRRKIPERPAFRRGVKAGEVAAREALLALLRQKPALMTTSAGRTKALEVVGEAFQQAIRKSYLQSQGLKPVSERRARVKKGTVGENRPLVGPEGPKLVKHITVRIGDREWTAS